MATIPPRSTRVSRRGRNALMAFTSVTGSLSARARVVHLGYPLDLNVTRGINEIRRRSPIRRRPSNSYCLT